jgi:pyruvate dehydrogenase E2 component (dihydrolipoamide acetyltransferase)
VFSLATPVIMPRQGQSVESCIITKWQKKPGDHVSLGDVLFTYETDKATFDEKAKTEGELLGVFFEEGDDVECLLNVCVIGQKGESYEEFDPKNASAEKKEEPEKTQQTQTVAVAQTEAAPVSAGTDHLKISPRAKNLVNTTGADLRYCTPTGPNGRIIERDIRKLIAEGKTVSAAAQGEYVSLEKEIAGTGIGGMISTADLNPSEEKKPTAAAAVCAAPDFSECEEVKLPNIRKVIARQMHASLSEMAQLTLNTSFDATEILAYRAKVKESREKLGLANITLNDIILFAVSRVLPDHKDLNANFFEDKIVYYKHVNLGVAVDTPRGLMVPTVFGADTMSLSAISSASKKLQDEAKSGTVNPDLLRGGTFTVTNLGGLGVESFTPVINPPQTGILGVDNVTTRVKMVGGEMKPYQAMGLSLTFDHRALDGAPAARFLSDLVSALENFSLLLAK